MSLSTRRKTRLLSHDLMPPEIHWIHPQIFESKSKGFYGHMNSGKQMVVSMGDGYYNSKEMVILWLMMVKIMGDHGVPIHLIPISNSWMVYFMENPSN